TEIVEHDALDVTGPARPPFHHRAHERAASPLREAVAGVKREPRDCDRRHPIEKRRLEPLARRLLADRRAVVVLAVRYERPAAVSARENHVDLVPAERAVLVLPDRAGLRMHG